MGFIVMDQNSQNIVLINNSSKNHWPGMILMLFLSSLDNLI